MKRKSFLKSLLTIPFIGSALLEVKSKPVSLDGIKQVGISTWDDKPTQPQEGSLYFRENNGMYIFAGGNWRLLATRSFIEGSSEPKLSLTDRRV